MRSRRLPAIVAVVVAIAGLAVVERTADGTRAAGVDVATETRALAPVTGPASALSTTWFCAGGTATDDGVADHTVVITNPTDEPVDAVVTAYPGTLAGAADAAEVAALGTPSSTVAVGPHARTEVRVGDLVTAPFAAALVEVDAGRVAVEHSHAGGGDTAAAPCASAASSSWSFATGATTRDVRELLVVFNPFPETAVVDMTFVVPEGARRPNELQAFPVDGGSVVAVDVGAVVTRYGQVSTAVTARTGRIVVDRIQTFDGSAGPRGMDVTLGAPRPAPLWFFPSGITGDGLSEVFSVFNPDEDRTAEVDLEVSLDDPATNGAVDPFEISVPPLGFVQVVMNSESRVPVGVAHSVTVRTANGVPVVAERFTAAGSPSSRSGVAYSTGSPVVATDWILGAGASTAESNEVVVLQNPSSQTIARVEVALFGSGRIEDVEQLRALEVQPAGRLSIDFGQILTADVVALLVSSDVPLVVERGLFRIGSRGLASSPGVAVFEGTAIPDPEAIG